MTRELKLIFYTCTLYVSFIYWGYLQEKITSSSYACESGTDNDALRWNFPRALNLVMAAAASLSAAFVGDVLLPLINPSVGADKSNAADRVVSAPFMLFAKPAITCAIGSPLGYMALKYIPFPLVILTKSSKPIPVMLIGIIFYRKSYPWYKHVGTFLLCSGIVAFSYWKQSGAHGAASGKGDDGDDFYSLCVGILLVGMNLALDGYTNNEQEHIFKKYQVSSCQMMKNVNVWQVIFLGLYLTFMHFVSHESGPSELQQAYNLLLNCSEARHDVAIFCLCAAVGQLTIFVVMKEFGSLMWITISITRKLFTILVSVIMFNHVICFEQWMGVAAVFAGLTLEVVMSYSNKGKNEQVKDTKKND